jgi:hypothetical protein
MRKSVLALRLFSFSTILIFFGLIFKVLHWPFGFEILTSGIALGTICVVYLIYKVFLNYKTNKITIPKKIIKSTIMMHISIMFYIVIILLLYNHISISFMYLLIALLATQYTIENTIQKLKSKE